MFYTYHKDPDNETIKNKQHFFVCLKCLCFSTKYFDFVFKYNCVNYTMFTVYPAVCSKVMYEPALLMICKIIDFIIQHDLQCVHNDYRRKCHQVRCKKYWFDDNRLLRSHQTKSKASLNGRICRIPVAGVECIGHRSTLRFQLGATVTIDKALEANGHQEGGVGKKCRHVHIVLFEHFDTVFHY